MRTVLYKVETSDKFNTENELECSMELACCSSVELADKAIEWLTDDDGWDEDDLEIIREAEGMPLDVVDLDGDIAQLGGDEADAEFNTIYEINCLHFYGVEDKTLARCSSERIAEEARQKLIEDGWDEESLEITELELNVIRINDKVIRLGELKDTKSDNVNGYHARCDGTVTLRNAEDGAAISEMKKGLNKVLKKYFVNYDFRLDGYYVDLWIEDRYEEEYIMELLNTLSPYITKGKFACVGQDTSAWRFVFNPEENQWNCEEGSIVYGFGSYTDEALIEEMERRGYKVTK